VLEPFSSARTAADERTWRTSGRRASITCSPSPGGHIAILNVLLFGLFRLVRMSRRRFERRLGAFLVFYTLLVEGSPSVLRATLMTLAFLRTAALERRPRPEYDRASAFALLLVNPSSLFDAGSSSLRPR